MTIAIACLLVIHGLLHLLGFIKAFQLLPKPFLKTPISKPAGLLWLTSALLFMACGIVLVLQYSWWWIFSSTGLVCSQYLIIRYWKDAKYGTIPNVVLLLFSGVGFVVWAMI